MPMYYTNENGEQIWKRDQVKEHIRKEAHAIAEPDDRPPNTEEDAQLKRKIKEEVLEMQEEAHGARDWKPEWEDVATMMKYLRRAYTRKTAPGPDDITPDLIIYADGIFVDCLKALLLLMAEAASSPDSWRKMLIVMAQKPGKDPQDIRKGCRPICVGSILMKAVEQVAHEWTKKRLLKKPHHPASMAYQRGTGHDMAVLTVTAAMLHVKYEVKERN
jgi:hypothetical protein